MCHSLERTRRALVLRKPKFKRNLTIGDDCGKGMQRIFWCHLRFVSKRLTCWDFIMGKRRGVRQITAGVNRLRARLAKYISLTIE